MGKTTNSLLSAGDFALTGQVYIDSLRTLHITTANTLGLSEDTINGLNELLNEIAKLLEGTYARTQHTRSYNPSGRELTVPALAGNDVYK
jgi:hypothetical protein